MNNIARLLYAEEHRVVTIPEEARIEVIAARILEVVRARLKQAAINSESVVNL